MADDIWSGITDGMAANRAAAQQDADNQQAQSDALAKQIAQQHTDQLEQAGLLIRKQAADNQQQQVKQMGDYQTGELAARKAETDRKTKADEDKATANAASLKGAMDRAKATLDQKALDGIRTESDAFQISGGLDPDEAERRALGNALLRRQGYTIPNGQIGNPGTVKADAKQLPGSQGAQPAGSVTPQPAQPGLMGPPVQTTMSGDDIMNQLMMPQAGQQTPGLPQAPQMNAPDQGQQGQGQAAPSPGSQPLPMVAAKMGQINANIRLTNAHADNFDANTQATNLLSPIKANKLQSDIDYTKFKEQDTTDWHHAMEKHWATTAAATKAYQDATIAIRQNQMNGRADQKPIAEFRALASAKAQMGQQLLGMDKQLQQMGKEKATLTGIMQSARPDPTADPNGARQWDLIQRVGPDRIADLNTRTDAMNQQFKAASDDMQTYRGLLLSRTNVMKDNGRTDQKGTSQLQKAAGKAATPKPAPKAKPTASSVLQKFGLQ